MKRRSAGQLGSMMTSSGGKRLVRRTSPPLEMERGARKRHRSFSPPRSPPQPRNASPLDNRVGKPIIDKRQHRRSQSGERVYDPGTNKYDKFDGGKRPSGLTPEQRFAKFDNYEKYARYQKEIEKQEHSSFEKVGRFDHYGKYEKESFEYSLRVGNLNYNISEKETAGVLFQEFKRYGFIDVKVLGQRHDRHAFVNFIRYEDAKRARTELQNSMLFGRGIHIEWSKSTLNRKLPEFSSPKQRPADSYETIPSHSSLRDVQDLRDLRHAVRNSSTRISSSNSVSHGHAHNASSSDSKTSSLDPTACRTLFVGNLHFNVTERELRDLFSQYGRIETVDIKHQNAFHTAYSFIKFMTINDAINAKDDMHGRMYHSMELKVGFGRGTQPGRVWCGNITTDTDVSELEKLFDRFGTIRFVDYHEGDDHAFFHFDDMDAAQVAIDSLARHRFRSGLPLKIDWARGPKHGVENESEFRRHTFENDRREVLYEKKSPPKKRHSMPDDSYGGRKHTRTEPGFGGGGGGSNNNSMQRLSTRHRSPPPPPQHTNFENKFHRKKTSSYRGGGGNSSTGGGGHHFVFETDDHDPEPPPFKKQREHVRGPFGKSHVRENNTGGSSNHIFSNREFSKPSRHDSGYTESSGKEVTENTSNSVTEVRANGAASTSTAEDKANSIASSGGFVEDEPNVKPDTTNPETLSDLAKHFPIAWKGCMVLKNTAFPTRMHLIGGDPGVAEVLLRSKDESTALLKISQRLRLEGPRLDEVNKRIQSAGPGGHCLLLAMSGPTPSQSSPERPTDAELPQQQTGDENLQFRPLKSLVTYLKQKQAAGIVALNPGVTTASTVTVDEKNGKTDANNNSTTASASTTATTTAMGGGGEMTGVLHAFPPCDFSQSQLCRVAPSLGQEPCKEDHIVVVVVRGSV